MKIVTNNQHRPILFWWDLTEKERQKFYYLDSTTEQESAQFVRYKGELYDLGEFTRATIPGWDGAQAHSYFNGMLIRYGKHYETVQIARYYQ